MFFLSLSIVIVMCFSADEKAQKGMNVEIQLNRFGLPIITLCQKYRLLLDTGSKDTWIADLSCQGCPEKTSICPQSQQKSQEIKYFKGAIQGDLAFVGTCLGSHRIICATQAHGMQEMGAMGILGLRKNSTGKNMLKTILQNHNIQQHSFAFYQGYRENILFFGEVPQRYIQKELVVSKSQHQWEMQAKGLTICGQNIQGKGFSLFIDTGSNMLIVPKAAEPTIKTRLIVIMKQMSCLEQSQRLTFYCLKQPQLQQELFVIHLLNGSSINISLDKVLRKNEEIYKFLIQSGEDNKIIIGGSLMSSYIVNFHLDGTIQIFQSNKTELFQLQTTNFKLILAEYLALIAGFSLLFSKVYQLAEVAINRKIVI